MDTPNTFTVDLTQIGMGSTANDDRVKRRADQLLPSGSVEILDADGSLIGTIGQPIPKFNLDEEVTTSTDNTEPYECETEEQLDELLFIASVHEEILNRITVVSGETKWSGDTLIDAQRHWIAEVREGADERRAEIREEVAEQDAEAQSCNGSFNRALGEIYHTPGVFCPIHLMQLDELLFIASVHEEILNRITVDELVRYT